MSLVLELKIKGDREAIDGLISQLLDDMRDGKAELIALKVGDGKGAV